MPGLIALAAAYVLSQFYRSFLAVLTPALEADIGADKGDLSLAAGLWFVSFALMQFIVGPALDRYGPRRTAAWIFAAGAGAGTTVFSMAESAEAVILGMTMIGIGCSPVLMASLYLFGRRFSAARFALFTSCLVAFGNLGNIIGSSPLAVAVEQFGWREVLAGLAVVSVLLAVCIGLGLRDPVPVKQTDGAAQGYLSLLRQPVLWPILVMTLFCYAPVAGIRGLWIGPFLADLHLADSLLIGKLSLGMAVMMMLGSLFYGPVDRWVDSRKRVVITGNLLVLLALLALAANPLAGLSQLSLLFMMIGMFGTSYGVLMAHGRAFLPSRLLGRGVTLLNFCSIFGAGATQFLTGRLMDAQPDNQSVEAYQLLFMTYGIGLGLALLAYCFARDAKPSMN